MKYEVVDLKERFENLKNPVKLSIYALDNSPEIEEKRKRPAILILPGGGYGFTSDREAEPVAARFLGFGYSSFILRYSTNKDHYPTQLLEISAAIAYIRERADELHIDPDKIIVCGFSAGGHAAGTIGNFWNSDFIYDALDIPDGANRPNGLILCYPVITSGKYAHRGSFENLLGDNCEGELLENLSLENSVSADPPPAFVWHTAADPAVPVMNSILYTQALAKVDIPFELHIFSEGGHGLSMADETTASQEGQILPQIQPWFDLCITWLKQTF